MPYRLLLDTSGCLVLFSSYNYAIVYSLVYLIYIYLTRQQRQGPHGPSLFYSPNLEFIYVSCRNAKWKF